MKFFLTIILVLFASAALAQPTEEWVARYNGSANGWDIAYALTMDAPGNIYVTGASTGNGTDYDYSTIKYDPDGNQVWVARYNGPVNGADEAWALAVDGEGNLCVTGRSIGSGTDYDYATVKYDSLGNSLWVARYNGPGNSIDVAADIAADVGGNVYVTGRSVGSGTDCDYATIKYDHDSNQIWVARYNGPGNGYDRAMALALDVSGNLHVTGYSKGSGTNHDYATIKYDANGNELWVARYNGPADDHDEAYDLAVDAEGNVYVTGFSADAGPNRDYATIKYDSGGTEVWVARYDGPVDGHDEAWALAVDSKCNVYVTGYSVGSGTDFDYTTLKYDSLGNQLWVARYNGPASSDDRALALVVDTFSNVYVTGRSWGAATDYDYTTAKYDSLGNQLWVARYNGPGDYYDRASDIVVNASGDVFVTGHSYGSGTEFDYATVKYRQDLVTITCGAPSPWFCRGKNFYFELTVTNNTGGDISGTLTFAGYSGYDCNPAHVLVTIPRPRTYPPGVTQQYYFLKVPRWVVPGHYSASVSGALSGYEVLCCVNTDIIQCGPWRIGENTEWELVEVERPEAALPTVTSLARNYPNPFNTTTEITYALAEAGDVQLTIYNLGGQLIETLIDGYQDVGEYEVIWDASGQASGVYFYKLTAGDFTEVRRMTLLK